MTPNVVIKKLGLCNYQQTWQEMRNFTLNRGESTPDEIWLLEHPPVFTQGMAGKPEHVLNPGNIPIIQTDRGGQVTYHGPGQLVGYVLLDLRRLKIGVKTYVSLIENSVVQLLVDYNIKANIKPDAPGVYVTGKKICSIGLKISRGCSYHGIALNVNNDLEPFSRINPCGFQNLQMTRISDFAATTLEEVGQKFCEKLCFLCFS
ncbi:lipoyl(octanoyl) transferase [Gammaproteobacteria bacterium]